MAVSEFHYKYNRLQQLRGFCFTVQLGSQVKAAKLLGLSPPALSMQISALEEALGTELFLKDNKRRKLTRDGDLLYDIAMPLVQNVDKLFESFLEQRDRRDCGSLDISANHVSIVYLLPRILRAFRDEMPDCALSVNNSGEDEGFKKLRNRETDCFIYPMTENCPADFDFVPLATFLPVMITPKGHPLSLQDNPDLKELEKHKVKVLHIDPQHITMPDLRRELEMQITLKSDINMEGGDWEMMKAFVAQGLGVAFISGLCLTEADKENLGFVNMNRYQRKMTYGAFVNKSRHIGGALEMFLKQAEKVTGGMS